MKRLALLAIAAATMLSLLPLDTHAGGRRFRRHVTHHHRKAVKVVALPQATYVIQNNIAQPLVGLGQTAYQSTTQPNSYAAQTLPFFDPNRWAADRLQLSMALTETASQDNANVARIVERIVEHEAPAKEAIARGHAARMTLEAAGLGAKGRSSRSAIVIENDGLGTRIRHLTAPEVERLRMAPEAIKADVEATSGDTLLGRFCSQCHGGDLAQPKGEFFLDYRPEFAASIRGRLADIFEAVDRKEMPTAKAKNQPTDAERGALKDEILRYLYTQNERANE